MPSFGEKYLFTWLGITDLLINRGKNEESSPRPGKFHLLDREKYGIVGYRLNCGCTLTSDIEDAHECTTIHNRFIEYYRVHYQLLIIKNSPCGIFCLVSNIFWPSLHMCGYYYRILVFLKCSKKFYSGKKSWPNYYTQITITQLLHAKLLHINLINFRKFL